MDTALDLCSETRGDDVPGCIHLAHRDGDEASFTGGSTARLSVTLSDGQGFASDSGARLTAVTHAAVSLPGGALLAGLGLCAVAPTRSRRM